MDQYDSHQQLLIDATNFIIQNRLSVFPSSYIEREIPKSVLEQIMANAHRAPTHKLTEPWRFKVYTSTAKQAIAKALVDSHRRSTDAEFFNPTKMDRLITKFVSSAAVVAIILHRDEKERVPEWEEIASVAMAVQNMYLTCRAYDIGCYWSSTIVRNQLNSLHELADNETCLGFLFMGYYSKDLPLSPRSDLRTKVEWFSNDNSFKPHHP